MAQTHLHDRFLQRRGGRWQYVRRVPAHVAKHDERAPVIRMSLKTSDLAVARAMRDVLEHADHDLWAAFLSDRDAEAAVKRYAVASRRAAALGFSYRPVFELAGKADWPELTDRMETVHDARTPYGIKKAVLGGEPEPSVRLGVHAALRNHLAIEMRKLLYQPDVLQQRRPALARGLDIEVVDHRRSGSVRHRGFGDYHGRLLEEPSAGLGHTLAEPRCILRPGAQLDEAEQHFVSFGRQLINRTSADLGMNAIDQLPLYLGRQHRLPENLPPGRHWTGELLEEVLDAALPAAEVVEEQASHDPPAQARAPAQRGVGVGRAHDALGDEMVDLSRKGRLQTIGDMPGDFLVQSDRALAQSGVEVRDALDGLLRGLLATNDLDQRHEMGRVERMPTAITNVS